MDCVKGDLNAFPPEIQLVRGKVRYLLHSLHYVNKTFFVDRNYCKHFIW